jgi:hypothetical protein
MRSHRWLNRIAVLIGVLLLLVGALGFIVYKERPSLRRIASGYASLRRPRFVQTASRGFDFSPVVDAILGPEPIRPPHLSEEATDAVITRFIDSGDATVSICSQLGDLREAPPRGPAEFHAWAEERITNRMENPFLEAILTPLGAVLARPAVAPLAKTVRDNALSGNETPDFDVMQTQAKADMFASRAQLEDISLRAYHLYALFRGLNWHPELVSDPDTNEICEMFETRLQAALDGDTTGVSTTTEARELLNWMAANQVTTEEAGFDPALSGATSVLVTPSSLEIETAWMKKVVGSGLVLGLPPALEKKN